MAPDHMVGITWEMWWALSAEYLLAWERGIPFGAKFLKVYTPHYKTDCWLKTFRKVRKLISSQTG